MAFKWKKEDVVVTLVGVALTPFVLWGYIHFIDAPAKARAATAQSSYATPAPAGARQTPSIEFASPEVAANVAVSNCSWEIAFVKCTFFIKEEVFAPPGTGGPMLSVELYDKDDVLLSGRRMVEMQPPVGQKFKADLPSKDEAVRAVIDYAPIYR